MLRKAESKEVAEGAEWPKISIVTPSYNQEQFIGATIRSVLEQGYPNLEYVVIDGGSTDRSPEIIQSYAKGLAYWVSEKDRGHGHAVNKGFAQTSGEIMAWINSDDQYLPWSFAVVAEIFNDFPDVEWIVGVNGWWDSGGRLVNCGPVYKNVYDFLLGDFRWIQQESVFWRRSLWERAGGSVDESYRFMIDGELWCRFFRYAQLWHVPVLLSGWRRHGKNRAEDNYDMVMMEMKRAITDMKASLTRRVIENAAELADARRWLNRAVRIRLPVDWKRLVERRYRNALDEARYWTLRYTHDQPAWKASRKPWTV